MVRGRNCWVFRWIKAGIWRGRAANGDYRRQIFIIRYGWRSGSIRRCILFICSNRNRKVKCTKHQLNKYNILQQIHHNKTSPLQ